MSLDRMPLPPLTTPASSALFSARGHWVQRSPMPGNTSDVLELEGDGDGPASHARVYRDGQLFSVTNYVWHRAGGVWDLDHQETVITDGRLHDVLDVTWPTSLSTPSRATSSPPTFRAIPQPTLGYHAQDDCVETDEMNDDGSDPCQSQVTALNNAQLGVYAANVGVFAACVTPEPAEPAACAAALAAQVAANAVKDSAQNDLDACRAAHKSTVCTTTVTVSGGGGDSGGPYTDEAYCVYLETYDLDTGETISDELLYCE